MANRQPPRPPVRRPQLPHLSLPDRTPYEGPGLTPDGDHDTESLTDLDLAGADGGGSTFLDCLLRRCDLTETRLKRARLIDSVLDGVTGVGTDLAEAELRDVELTDARLGGTQMHGATLTRVHVRGGKLDYLNLRQARLTDVVFENCVLVEPDFGGATLERVAFRDCALRRADLSAARLREVDLRDAAELDIAAGVDRLSGAVISTVQLMDLAPALAAHLGLRVLD